MTQQATEFHREGHNDDDDEEDCCSGAGEMNPILHMLNVGSVTELYSGTSLGILMGLSLALLISSFVTGLSEVAFSPSVNLGSGHIQLQQRHIRD